MSKPRRSREPRRAAPAAAAATPGTTRHRWLALLLTAAGIVAFANTFSSPFVFDDHHAVLENVTIRQLSPLTVPLSPPPHSAMGRRPLVNLTLAVNYALGGVSPWGYHAWNLGVHIGCALLLFGILRRTLQRSGPRDPPTADMLAFVTALIWMVHPLQTEVISYITQRTESTMALCYLASVYCALRSFSADGPRARRWAVASVIACAMGMAAKESMVSAPLIVFLYDVVFVSGSPRRALGGRRAFYGALAATWLLLAALVVAQPRSGAGALSDVSPWMYLLNQAGMIVTYLRLTIWPHGLVLDYGRPVPVALSDVMPSVLIVAALFIATIAAWRIGPKLAFLGTWIFVTLAPTSSIVPIATEVGAERRMYLPLAALALLAVLAVYRALTWATARLGRTVLLPWLAGAITLAVGGGLVVLTRARNAEYHDTLEIWRTVLDRRPHGRAHYQYGFELRARGRREEAIRHFEEGVGAQHPPAVYAMGVELQADGRHAEAVEHFRTYVRSWPEGADALRAGFLIGRASESMGNTADAEAAYRNVLRLQPTHADARRSLAELLARERRFQDAAREYQAYLQVAPNDAAAYTNLGISLVGLQREADAIAPFTRAVQLSPNDPAFHLNLGYALAAVGRLDDAIGAYRRAAALTPAAPEPLRAIGEAFAAQQKYAEAAEMMRRADALGRR